MLFAPSKVGLLVVGLCATALGGCLIETTNQLYLADATVDRQSDDHLLTRATIRCDGDCASSVPHCVRVEWKEGSELLAVAEACSHDPICAGRDETHTADTKVPVAIGSSIAGTLQLVDGSGRPIPSASSSLGGAEETSETLANPD